MKLAQMLRLPLGVLAPTLALNTHSAATHYVNYTSTNPVAPYLDWSTAAKVIQNAVDVAVAGDTVLVARGTYLSGGRAVLGTLTNRVAITNAVLLQSANGPAGTTIVGSHPAFPSDPSARCLYVSGGAIVSGFTLREGGNPLSTPSGPDSAGCGSWCPDGTCVISNCIFTSNEGHVSVARGGTIDNCWLTNNGCLVASDATLNNCVIARNSGTGATNSALNNCTIVFNNSGWEVPQGAGTLNCRVTNSLVYHNPDWGGGNNYRGGYFESSCTWPLPANGRDNFTNSPGIVSTANFHLGPSSPCINAGRNCACLATTDLDGNARVAGGTVDIGAYEYQTPTSIISYAWMQHYGLSTAGSADCSDTDGDGMNNWQEWQCGTDPLDAASVLTLLSVSNTASGVAVTWQSVSNRTYSIERATDLTGPAPFSAVATGVAGQPSLTTFTDTGATNAHAAYYRVRGEP